MMPTVPLTARAPWKGVGEGSLFRVLAQPHLPDYYQGRERSSGLLGNEPLFLDLGGCLTRPAQFGSPWRNRSGHSPSIGTDCLH
jgi:hypothetical protein